VGIDGCIKKIYSYALFHCWETVGIYGCDKKKKGFRSCCFGELRKLLALYLIYVFFFLSIFVLFLIAEKL
jgi:hypothetical protein